MTEFNKFPLVVPIKEGSETAVTIAEDGGPPLTFLRLQTDTQVINHRLYVEASELPTRSGLSKSEVRERLANAPEDKTVSLGDKQLVRLSTALGWNVDKLQSNDPSIADRANRFHNGAYQAIINHAAMLERSISASKVKEKSNKAKEKKRKDLQKAGQDQVCQLSQAPINGQPTHIHHIVRVADAPELAAEQSNLLIALVEAHQEKHKNDKTLPQPPNSDD